MGAPSFWFGGNVVQLSYSSEPSFTTKSRTSPLPPAKPFNVFLLALDATSRLNTIRQLPKTRSFVLNTLNATEFLFYNAVGKNTKTNVGALFTGDTEGNDFGGRQRQTGF